MRAKVIILTGVLGWVGGIATIAVASSCDQDPCMTDDEGCDDPIPRDMEVTNRTPPITPDPPPFPITSSDTTACDMMARPSAHVYVAREYDDYMMHVPVDAVWYEWNGQTYEAMCMGTSDGDCNSWIAGWEKDGPIKIFTEYCDQVFDVSVDIGRTEDDCHVATKYVLLPVGTRGCVTTTPPPAPPPPGPGDRHVG